jgi:hypothetical protein
MSSLIAATVFFLLIHFGVSGTRLRDVLVARMGAGFYRGALVFAAIAAGRNQFLPAVREIGILRPVIAIAAFAVIMYFHGQLFGAALTAAS